MAVRDPVKEHRRRMRARGHRLLQVWVPDVRSAEFAHDARRQALAVREADRRSDDQDFADAISADWDA